MSVWEIAKFTVRPGDADAFRAVALGSIPLFKRQPGCSDWQLLDSAEDPGTFWLLIEWETIAHHTEQFATSPDFTTWVDAVSPYYAADPVVDHAERFVRGF